MLSYCQQTTWGGHARQLGGLNPSSIIMLRRILQHVININPMVKPPRPTTAAKRILLATRELWKAIYSKWEK